MSCTTHAVASKGSITFVLPQKTAPSLEKTFRSCAFIGELPSMPASWNLQSLAAQSRSPTSKGVDPKEEQERPRSLSAETEGRHRSSSTDSFFCLFDISSESPNQGARKLESPHFLSGSPKGTQLLKKAIPVK